MSEAGPASPRTDGARRRGALLVAVVFVLGLVCGAAATVIGMRGTTLRRPARPYGEGPQMGRGMQRMVEELDLTEEQQRAVREVFERTRGRIHEAIEESGEEIRAVLDESQRARFDRMRERHRGPGRRRGGGP